MFGFFLFHYVCQFFSDFLIMFYWFVCQYFFYFLGGGFEFIRYNCSIDKLEAGQVLIFPGDLTHAYVTKPLTKGEMLLVNGKMNARKHICYEKYGVYECAGFDSIKDGNIE